MKHLPSSSWSIQPFSRLAIFFSSGCLLSKLFIFSTQNLIILSCFWILLFTGLTFFYFKTPLFLKHSIFTIRGLFIWGVFLFAGLLNAINSQNIIPNQLDSFIGKNIVLIIQIDSEPRIKSGTLTIDCKILKILCDSNNYLLNSKIRVQIKDGSVNTLQFAQCKIICGKLFYPNPSSKPGDFDYASFLKSKGISSIIHVDSSHVFNVMGDEFSFQRLAFNWRSFILKQFHDDVLKSDEKQVASALLLCDRSEMNSELLKEYSSGGIIHILAVSGLHVGLIYQLCIWIFKYFKFLKRNRIDMLLIISILWIYATMTGLSPSVNRAVCMFTLLAFADFLNRKVSPFNILSSAAFILLLIQPDAIFDMGFQLSFSAVWGILSARPILDLIKGLGGKFATFILTPIIISIAAQIATAPFTFYAFGTFPTWFLPANLIAVPLSTILTYLGIAAIVFSNFFFLGKGLMTLFSLGIQSLNKWAQFISNLPNAQLCNFKISLLELVCYSVSVYILFYLLKKRSYKIYAYFLCSLLIGVLYGFFSSKSNTKYTDSLIYTSQNTFHFHSYSNSIDHHYVLFPTDFTIFSIPEFEKLISPIYIRNNQVMLHPVFLKKNLDKAQRSVLFLSGDKLLHVDISNPFIVFSHKPMVIVLNTNVETLKYLELNKMNIRCIIPVPWLNAIHKIRLKNFASKCSIQFYDPEKSGWRNFVFDWN